MAGSVRREVILTEEEDRRLRQCARERGLTEEELLRDGVRRAIGGEGSATNRRAEREQGRAHVRAQRERVRRDLALLEALESQDAGGEERRAATQEMWERELATLRALTAGRPVAAPSATPRGWTREDLYDERLQRFTH